MWQPENLTVLREILNPAPYAASRFPSRDKSIPKCSWARLIRMVLLVSRLGREQFQAEPFIPPSHPPAAVGPGRSVQVSADSTECSR